MRAIARVRHLDLSTIEYKDSAARSPMFQQKAIMPRITIPIAEIGLLVTAALMANRTSERVADSVSRALVRAEVDGHIGHGLSRVTTYAAQARCGKVDGVATPDFLRTRSSSAIIDARHGFAYPALDLACEHLPSLARDAGIAAVGIRRSHHFGVAGQTVERLADAGLIAIVMGNTPRAMAAIGGIRPIFGTNPIAFACPRRDACPVIVDLALSQVARGRILIACRKGEPIPVGWAVDAQGDPTTDAKAALAGTLLPFGGPKGAALALMVEIMAAALTGANFAFEASSFLDEEGSPPGVGQVLIAIDPAAFAGREVFLDRVAMLAAVIESEPGARLPGSRRMALRDHAERHGVSVDAKTLAGIRSIAVGQVP